MDESSAAALIMVSLIFFPWVIWVIIHDGAIEKEETGGNSGTQVWKDEFRPALEPYAHYHVYRHRQSGHVEDKGIMTGHQAAVHLKRAFSRSNSNQLLVRSNTADMVTVDRGYYHGRGTQEGKRIQRVVCKRVETKMRPLLDGDRR